MSRYSPSPVTTVRPPLRPLGSLTPSDFSPWVPFPNTRGYTCVCTCVSTYVVLEVVFLDPCVETVEYTESGVGTGPGRLRVRRGRINGETGTKSLRS